MQNKRTIEIKVLKGRDLKAMDLDGTSDPFVVIKVNDKKSKTKVINSTLNPEWNETFFFDVTGQQIRILLTVWDKDPIGKDFMGQVIIPHLDTLTALHGPVEKWYELEKKKSTKKAKGEILVRISFRDSPDSNFNAESAKQLKESINEQNNQIMNQQELSQIPPPSTSNQSNSLKDSFSVPPSTPPPPPPQPPSNNVPSSSLPPPQPPSNNIQPPSNNVPPSSLPPPQPPSNNIPQINDNIPTPNQGNSLKDSFSIPPSTPPPPPPTQPPVSTPEVEKVKVEYDFNALNEEQISCLYGEILEVVERSGEWIKLKKDDGSIGWVPTAYVSDL